MTGRAGKNRMSSASNKWFCATAGLISRLLIDWATERSFENSILYCGDQCDEKRNTALIRYSYCAVLGAQHISAICKRQRTYEDWSGERMEDEPKVSDDLLERLKGLSMEEVWDLSDAGL